MSGLGTASDIALIFLVIQALIGCLVPLAIFGGLAYGVMKLNRKVEETMPTARGYSRRLADGAEQMSQQVTAPLVNLHAKAKRWQTMAARLTKPKSK